MGIIALVAFWTLAIRLWAVDGPKVPLVFILLWMIGFFGFPLLGFSSYVFIAFEAGMAAVLLVVERYKSAM